MAQRVACDVEGVLIGIRERGGAQRFANDGGEGLRERGGGAIREGYSASGSIVAPIERAAANTCSMLAIGPPIKANCMAPYIST